ncbi:hypothetical protein SDC9_83315 [bioreactor metagenome]|uniref:Uncharacterized protein n=1 Tax=bioreactor metagenome TaxID=1076179 RepID=A0A644ZDC4_9ZZZZ
MYADFLQTVADLRNLPLVRSNRLRIAHGVVIRRAVPLPLPNARHVERVPVGIVKIRCRYARRNFAALYPEEAPIAVERNLVRRISAGKRALRACIKPAERVSIFLVSADYGEVFPIIDMPFLHVPLLISPSGCVSLLL